MNDIAIKVENVSKQYRLGEISTGTLFRDLNRWWYELQGKENPYLKIGETNDRTTKGNSEFVWALKDLNFEVKKGEVLGIIGRNGAGKSTLLKILSSTTSPTTGQIKINGKIASLLEVGTGFHPDLSGRDNIFLNGAILGMSKREIKAKFDEIVDFSGVERYIDTPVKRYSSGMYVRLAFAVAAHLEPDILIVDEVLAVGDAEFQKKCLGKMKDVSVNDGRTVLFVSHNLSAIKELCDNAILLNQGQINLIAHTHDVVKEYLFKEENNKFYFSEEDKNKTHGQINSINLYNSEFVQSNLFFSESLPMAEISYKIKIATRNFNIGYTIIDELENHIYSSSNTDLVEIGKIIEFGQVGIYKVRVNFPLYNLNSGNYRLKVVLGQTHVRLFDTAEVRFSILNQNFLTNGNRPGILISLNHWNYLN